MSPSPRDLTPTLAFSWLIDWFIHSFKYSNIQTFKYSLKVCQVLDVILLWWVRESWVLPPCIYMVQKSRYREPVWLSWLIVPTFYFWLRSWPEGHGKVSLSLSLSLSPTLPLPLFLPPSAHSTLSLSKSKNKQTEEQINTPKMELLITCCGLFFRGFFFVYFFYFIFYFLKFTSKLVSI